jgi:spore coat protein CotH
MHGIRWAIVAGLVAAFAGAAEAPKAEESAAFFKSGPIPRLKISLDDDNLKQLHASARAYVRCTVTDGTTTWADVGLHLKGAAGSFRPFEGKPALTLKFDKFQQGQRFHGLDKVHLNNSVQDPAYLTEILCGELFLAAKAPTARGTHAVVELQGKKRGLFVLKEGYDTTFLKHHFKDASGHLYDGGFIADIDSPIKQSGSAGAPDHADLKALAAACREPDLTQRVERIGKLLDVDRFITMMALEVMTWHWDGYGMKSNNYRIYHDPKSDKLVFIPHGMDQMFWEPQGAISPPMGGLVARALFESPEMRKRYYKRVGELAATIFTAEKLIQRIDEIHDRVRPTAAEIDPDFARQFDRQVADLKERVKVRTEFVDKQIKAKLEQIAQRP